MEAKVNKTNNRPENSPKLKTAVLTLGLLAALSACQKNKEADSVPVIEIETEAPAKTPATTPGRTAETSGPDLSFDIGNGDKSVQKMKMKVRAFQPKLKDFLSPGSLKDLNQVRVEIEIDELEWSHISIQLHDETTNRVVRSLSATDFERVGTRYLAKFKMDLNFYPIENHAIKIKTFSEGAFQTVSQIDFRPDVVVSGETDMIKLIRKGPHVARIRDLLVKDGAILDLKGQGLSLDAEDVVVHGQATLVMMSEELSQRARNFPASEMISYTGDLNLKAAYAEGVLQIENRGMHGRDGLHGALVPDSMASVSVPVLYVGHFWGPNNTQCAPIVQWRGTTDFQRLTVPVGHDHNRQMLDGTVGGFSEQVGGMRAYYQCIVDTFLKPLAKYGPAGNNATSGINGGSLGAGKIEIKQSNLNIRLVTSQVGRGGKNGLGSKGQFGPIQNPNFKLSLYLDLPAGGGHGIVSSPLAVQVMHEFFPGGRGPKGQDGLDGTAGLDGQSKMFELFDQNKTTILSAADQK
jgi:hypothetical protein